MIFCFFLEIFNFYIKNGKNWGFFAKNCNISEKTQNFKNRFYKFFTNLFKIILTKFQQYIQKNLGVISINVIFGKFALLCKKSPKMSFLTKFWAKYQPIYPKLNVQVELGGNCLHVIFWGEILTFGGFIKKKRLKVAYFIVIFYAKMLFLVARFMR